MRKFVQFHFGFLLVLVVLFCGVNLFAQQNINILLVDDDNYSSPDHLPSIETAITDAGYTYTVFDAQTVGRSPTAAELGAYDLVIWYLANDGAGSYFWNGNDTENAELENYLSSGGFLWAIGNDILYDMYGGAPDNFSSGDFPYDYLGISSYDVQSKVDDGGVGLPQLDVVAGNGICTMTPLSWYVSGLWYADGCTPKTDAVSVYQMGPGTYTFAGYSTVIYVDNVYSKVIFSGYDPYYFDTAANRAAHFQEVLDFFNTTDASLPVELSAFTARAGDSKAVLHWTTQSEINNAGFEIYRAQEENGDFALISSFENNPQLKGAGNSSKIHRYTFIDAYLVNGTKYWYKLADVDFNGRRSYHGPVSVIPNKSGINIDSDGNIPGRYALYANYPNPFNPETQIAFDIPDGNGAKVMVNLTVYNMLGQKVRTLISEALPAGSYKTTWDGRDDSGRAMTSGVYIYGIRTEKFASFKKMMLMK